MDVFLLGIPQPGVERSALVSNLATAEKMLRRPRTLVKADIEPALAEKYKSLIEKAGGQCELLIHGQEPEPLPTETPKAKHLTLEPVAAQPISTDEDDYDDSDGGSFCAKCGSLIRIGRTKCPKCFTPQTEFVSKDKTTAGLLAFFVGGLGIHRFYLGQWWGIFYFLFWGTFIPSIVSIVEAIVFWSTSNEKWNEKYGNVKKSEAFIVVIIICGIFMSIAIVGILAAIALPAYQDYTNRSKIQSAMPIVVDARDKVTKFILETHIYPSENIFVHLPDTINDNVIESIKLQDGGKLEVTYRIVSLHDKNTIIWIPTEKDGKVIWSCSEEGTMVDRYRPTECRGGIRSEDTPTNTTKTGNKSGTLLYSSDKSISINLPAGWKKNNELLPSALIGANNIANEMYIVVMGDSKVDYEDNIHLSDYTKIIQKQLASIAKNSQVVGDNHDITISGLPATQFVFTGTINDIKITYLVTLTETNKSFYRVLSWTLASKFEKNKSELTAVSNSLAWH
jgi:TM2 domain-containing membrane protein YozV/Tfp pilus assembly protein PilE